MSEKMKVAVIGGCVANSAHIPSYRKLDEWNQYFCDLIPEKAQPADGTAVLSNRYKQALADPEVKALSVCTPNKDHKFISIDALHAGKHVLCEKPAARDYSEALEMQKAQHETGLTLNIGVVNRFSNAVRLVKQMIDAGELGEVYHV